MRVTGLELQEFFNEVIKDLPEFYFWDEEQITFPFFLNKNNLEIDPEYYKKLFDLKIFGDIDFDGSRELGRGYSFASAFNKWKKKKDTSYILISCSTKDLSFIQEALSKMISKFKNIKIQ